LPQQLVFSINLDEVLPEGLDIYLRIPEVCSALAELSGGTNVRLRRLRPSVFPAHEMPVPSMATQLKIREVYQRTHSLKIKYATIRRANVALLPATLERLFLTEVSDHA